MKNMYQQRHNRVVDLVHNKIVSVKTSCEIVKDKVLKASDFCPNSENFRSTNTRPDIVLINREDKEVIIIEISTPFDAFLGRCYSEKFNKYYPLSTEINALGFRTRIFVLVIGSLAMYMKDL